MERSRLAKDIPWKVNVFIHSTAFLPYVKFMSFYVLLYFQRSAQKTTVTAQNEKKSHKVKQHKKRFNYLLLISFFSLG